VSISRVRQQGQQLDNARAREVRPTLEMLQVLRHLSELVELAMGHARQPSHQGQLQLASIQLTVKILVDVVNCIEHRDIQQGLRQLESSLARTRAERERWD
jgi:hypothetical protein